MSYNQDRLREAREASRRSAQRGLAERLAAQSYANVPPHKFVESAALGEWSSCRICTLGQTHLIHSTAVQSADLDELGVVEDESDQEPDTVNGEVPTGVMVALYPEPAIAAALRVPGGEKPRNLHVTLAFMPDAADVDTDKLAEVVRRYAIEEGHVLRGQVSGVGVFTAEQGKTVTYASVDVPDLPAFRQGLVQVLDAAGFTLSAEHGFTPHITLAYKDRRNATVPNVPLTFSTLTLAVAGQRMTFPMTAPQAAAVDSTTKDNRSDDKGQIVEGETDSKGVERHDYVQPTGKDDYEGAYPPCELCDQAKDSTIHGGDGVGDLVDITTLLVSEPKVGSKVLQSARHTIVHEGEETPTELSKAFVSDINGRTFITGQASAFVRQFERAAFAANPHMLWMEGRFVGAEKANRNGAFWTTGDLEMGNPSVKNGPLNWLHEAKHIIGTIADSRLVTHEQASDTALAEPYIQAAAGIWTWIYPDEAYVVEQASEQGRLWYSMECISNDVQCVGDGSCGETASYRDYLSGDGCIHMNERSADRRFVNPVFLGGAVIVPPVRPGWADADARVMAEAASMAEKAYDQAGQPDMPASQWELMMAQIVKMARG